MKVAFKVDRIGYYRYFGPLIEKAFRAGSEVVLLHRNLVIDRTGYKGYQWADPAAAPSFRFGVPAVRQWASEAELFDVAVAERVDALVTVWASSEPTPCAALRDRGVAWIALQDAFDFHPYASEMLLRADVTCLFSEYWIELIERYYPDAPRDRLRAALTATGWPELDWFYDVDRAAIRARLGVPAGAAVVALATYKQHLNDPWEQIVFRPGNGLAALAQALRYRRLDLLPLRLAGVTYQRFLRSLRRFCDANGAFLVSKARTKDAPPRLERALADRTLEDDSHHPPTVVEVAAVTDLWVSFLSASTLEAVYGGAYCLSPLPPEASYWLNDPFRARFRSLAGYREPGSIWNFPGIVEQVSLARVIEELPGARLERFRPDPAKRREYVDRFLGGEGPTHAARVWDLVERTVERKRSLAARR